MSQPDRLSVTISEQCDQQLDFLRRLIRTKSSNPFTPDTSQPDAPIEREAADLIHKELQHIGFNVTMHGISSQRPNVLCHIPGSGDSAKTLILTAHMDTVEPANYTRNPWGAQIEHGRLYGVGAADAKAQIAVFMYALHALRKAGIALAGNVTLAFVVDEEAGACSPYGTQYLLQQGLLRGDAVIIGEPVNEKIAIGHRGLYRFRIQTRGEAIHTGTKAWEQHTQGHNAILDMAHIIQTLESCSLPHRNSNAFPGRTSVFTFPTLLRGGTGINIVPDFCEAYGDVRLLPGLSASEVREIIETQLAHLPQNTYQIEEVIAIPAVEIDPKTEIVQSLKEAAEEVTGGSPRVGGSGPACDGWMFITKGIPTICGYGVACGGAHGTDEWVDIENIRVVTEIYARAIIRYFTEHL
jgi:acetylornithine deacetylase/succinyl-diaminopimelate desuccinylase family protein